MEEMRSLFAILTTHLDGLTPDLSLLATHEKGDDHGTWHAFEKWLTCEMFLAVTRARKDALPEPMYSSYLLHRSDRQRADLLVAWGEKPNRTGVLIEVAVVHPKNMNGLLPKMRTDREKFGVEQGQSAELKPKAKEEKGDGYRSMGFMQIVIMHRLHAMMDDRRAWTEWEVARTMWHAETPWLHDIQLTSGDICRITAPYRHAP